MAEQLKVGSQVRRKRKRREVHTSKYLPAIEYPKMADEAWNKYFSPCSHVRNAKARTNQYRKLSISCVVLALAFALCIMVDHTCIGLRLR